MKKFLFPLLILGMVFIFFWQFLLKGLIPVPADTIVGLYYPYRDFYAKDYPRGIPFKNFMITDPVRQQYPWKYLVIEQEKKGQLPLWNPYTFSGAPLLGNFQSGAFYPLNLIFLLLPFSFDWGIFILLQPLLAAIFLFFYLKNLKLDDRAGLLGSISFAFGGFSISWLEWGTVIHTALWLPLILLSVDKIITNFKSKTSNLNLAKWSLIFILSLVFSFFAGHLQVFFYICLLTFAYFLAKVISHKEKGKIFTLFVSLGIIFLFLSLIALIPGFKFISLSARGLDQDWHTIVGWFLPWQNIVQVLIPDFFGNPSTLNYWGVWNYGEFVSYVGVVGVVFAVLSLFRKDKKTLFFLSAVLISLVFAFPTVIAKLPYKFNFPLISTSQPTRLVFIIDFSLSILAALGFDYFLKNKKKMFYALGFVSIIFLFVWAYVLFILKNLSPENFLITKQNLIFSSALFFVSIVLLVPMIYIKNKKVFNIFSAVVIIFLFLDLLRFGWKYTPFTDKNYLYPNTKTLSFLSKNSQNFRIMSTDSRIFPPNFSIMYKLQTIDGYDPLYLQVYGELIAAVGRSNPNINPPFGFNRIITMQNYHDTLIDLLGVKYVLSFDDLNSKYLEKVFTEGDTKVYENKNVLPRAFFVRSLTNVVNNQEAISFLFKNQNDLRTSAVVEDYSSAKPEWDWYRAQANITSYQDNRIEISTKNKGEGFMVLTDSYYPTWHAKIDGKEVKIYRTDYNFRGIIVPKGEHKVEFYDSLF